MSLFHLQYVIVLLITFSALSILYTDYELRSMYPSVTHSSQTTVKMHPKNKIQSIHTKKAKVDILKLWHAKHYSGEKPDLSTKSIHIVIAHCSNDLHWTTEITNNYDISSVHIISKCGQPIENAPAGYTKERIPNTGRNDHSYAHYITKVLDKKISETGSTEENSIVLFLKDNNRERNDELFKNNYEDLITVAASNRGFACGLVSSDKYSAYHYGSYLYRFAMNGYEGQRYVRKEVSKVKFKSMFENLGQLFASLDVKLPQALTQVCYGGNFAASVTNIKKVDKKVWIGLEALLGRGDNIEEGHFMERFWGTLLSTPLNGKEIHQITDYASAIYTPSCCFTGALMKATKAVIKVTPKKKEKK